jgi:outer membrane protein assembly factor BamB
MYRTDAHEDRSLLLSGYDERVTAYRRDTGEVAWIFKRSDAYGYYVDFAIAGGRVFVAIGSSIACLEYKTGKVIGTTPLPSKVIRLILDEERIFAFGDEHVYCIALDGRILWQRQQIVATQSFMPTFGCPGNIVYGFRDSG